MKEETKKYVEELVIKDKFKNPSAITSCIYLFRVDKGLEEKIPYFTLHGLVKKEIDRVKKRQVKN